MPGWVSVGWVEDGWVSGELPPPPVTPVTFDLGSPGNPVFALPMQSLGGSVVDLDLLYGLLADADDNRDIKPIFVLATRTNFLRAYGMELPREEIRASCIESFSTL